MGWEKVSAALRAGYVLLWKSVPSAYICGCARFAGPQNFEVKWGGMRETGTRATTGDHSRLSAFFRFSPPAPVATAARLTAFVLPGVGCTPTATFASAVPRGEGET